MMYQRITFYILIFIFILFCGCDEKNDPDYYVPQNTKVAAPQKTFTSPALPMPLNGDIKRYHSSEAIAPFEIKTRSGSGNYYVKLVDWYTKQTVLTVFIREGQTSNIDVPLGCYEMKYAVGQTWYGETHLFGAKTACSKADDRFDFKQEGLNVSGYTVELYLQLNGNLATDQIPVSQF